VLFTEGDPTSGRPAAISPIMNVELTGRFSAHSSAE
jgi:hypothetical protein